jgi:hypothetical protein
MTTQATLNPAEEAKGQSGTLDRMPAYIYPVPARDRSNLSRIDSIRTGDFLAVLELFEAHYGDGLGINRNLLGFMLTAGRDVHFSRYHELGPRWKSVGAQLAMDHVYMDDWIDSVAMNANTPRFPNQYDAMVCTFRDLRVIVDGFAARKGPREISHSNDNGLIRPCIIEVEGFHSEADLIAIAERHMPLIHRALHRCYDAPDFEFDLSVWHGSPLSNHHAYKASPAM